MNYIYLKGGHKGNDVAPHMIKTENDEAFIYTEPWMLFKKWQHFLCHFSLSPTINSYLPLPFKFFWIKKIIKKSKFSNDNPLCILINAHFAPSFSDGVLKKMRKKYKGLKTVIYFTDKVDFYNRNYRKYPSLNVIKRRFNLVLSYNILDCEKHSLLLNRYVFNDYSSINDDESIPQSDIFFVGQNKNRLPKILSIYQKANKHGLKCDFWVTKVEDKDQLYKETIHYNQWLPYYKVLQRVRKTKCVLNIVQDGGMGITEREYEAIGNNKFLLTDNCSIKDTVFFSPDQIISLDDFEKSVYKIKNGCLKTNNYLSEYNYENYFKWLSDILKKN